MKPKHVGKKNVGKKHVGKKNVGKNKVKNTEWEKLKLILCKF
jgi:hypothetical protein